MNSIHAIRADELRRAPVGTCVRRRGPLRLQFTKRMGAAGWVGITRRAARDRSKVLEKRCIVLARARDVSRGEVARAALSPRGLFYLLGVAENDRDEIAALLKEQAGLECELIAERRAQRAP